MPCVLRYASKEEECKIMKGNQLSCPWIVRLSTRLVKNCYVSPSSCVLPTLIVLLLSSHLFSIVSGLRQYRNIFVLHGQIWR